MKPIITVTDLSKHYQLGGPSSPYSTLRESLVELARKPLAAFRRNGNTPTMWALKDVNFEIEQGEVVGIIGRNGAGKSTLLKILSRITEPTTGRVELFGRVASLLEVGTGFHPELTGRENIFLNGSILGMSRKEIESKFSEIVAFAEVEKFLDTPVKHYSSGMYVRLAFSVAAHLEPEILVIDEVLAVGDASFQKRCLGRMREVANGGRTVLFVSHNMAAVAALCSKAIVLRQGQVEHPLGDVNEAIAAYLTQVHSLAQTKLSDRTDRQGNGKIRITDFRTFDAQANELEYIATGQEVDLRIYYTSKEDHLENVTASISINSQTGSVMSLLSNEMASAPFQDISGQGSMVCKIKKIPLAPGTYTVNVMIRSNEIIQDWLQEAATLVVEPGDFFGTGRMPPQSHGGVLLEQQWDSFSG